MEAQNCYTEARTPYPASFGWEFEFPSTGPLSGLCIVDLPRGWTYTAKSRKWESPAYREGAVVRFSVPLDEPIRFSRQLERLVSLEIDTVDRDHQPTVARVEVALRSGDSGWTLARGGTTVATAEGGRATFTVAALEPGVYGARTRVANRPDLPWSEWQRFSVAIGLRASQTLTVPTPAR